MSFLGILDRHDDMFTMAIPEPWIELPEGMQRGLVWWELVEHCNMRRRRGRMLAASALYDIAFHFAEIVEELARVQLRADTHANRARIESLATSLDKGRVLRVVVCHYAWDEPAGLGAR